MGGGDYMYTKAKIAGIEKREKCRYTPLIMRLTGLGSDVLHIKRLKFDHYRQTIPSNKLFIFETFWWTYLLSSGSMQQV